MITYYAIGKFRALEEGAFHTLNMPQPHPSREFPTFHDLVYFESGFWSVNVCGTRYDLMPGDVLVLTAGVPCRGEELCSAGTGTIYLHLRPVIGDTIGGEPPQNDGITRIPLNTVIHCQNNEMISGLFSRITVLQASDRPEKSSAISAMLQTLLCLLADCGCRTETKNLNMIERCLEIMKQKPGVFFREEDMAKQLFVSAKTLRSAFSTQFGKTFYQYQLDSKLSQVSIYLLEQPDLKLSEIASELGFCDEFHLSKVFRKKYGIPPGMFRRKIQIDGYGV